MADTAPLFREEQRFRQWRTRLLLAIPPGAVTTLAVWQIGLGHAWGRYPMSNGGLVFLAVLLWAAYRWLTHVRLVTLVYPGSVVVRLTGLWREDRIDAGQVISAAPVAFDAAAEFGGYGWRVFRGGRAYLAGGTTGVRLAVRGGAAIVIGTERAADLVRAIERARAGGRRPDVRK